MPDPFQVADTLSECLQMYSGMSSPATCQTDRTVPSQLTSASLRNTVGSPTHTNAKKLRTSPGSSNQAEEGQGLRAPEERVEGSVAHQSGLWLSRLLIGRQGPSTTSGAPCSSTPFSAGGLLKLQQIELEWGTAS